METFRFRLLGREGEVHAQQEVTCERRNVWQHAGALMAKGPTSGRLHITDATGEILAIMGTRSAKLSLEMPSRMNTIPAC